MPFYFVKPHFVKPHIFANTHQLQGLVRKHQSPWHWVPAQNRSALAHQWGGGDVASADGMR